MFVLAHHLCTIPDTHTDCFRFGKGKARPRAREPNANVRSSLIGQELVTTKI